MMKFCKSLIGFVFPCLEVPNARLFGAQRINITTKASKSVTFTLKSKVFQILNNHGKRVFEPGEFLIQVVGSNPLKRSADLGASIMSPALIALN